ncbi:hypothetical protein LC087_17625 [Bacillus carboniphilus]|uniref:Lipoprotein n=1 Tax=Bacillus carboniphilus TaxID=86663 RepID=A0ABY9JT09_9BACI|nr:hypothetical protein [Bacillus carboniphilus]WLR42492.1 hypothetical protein LC087_17625 [Bacillus carboniphilus]
MKRSRERLFIKAAFIGIIFFILGYIFSPHGITEEDHQQEIEQISTKYEEQMIDLQKNKTDISEIDSIRNNFIEEKDWKIYRGMASENYKGLKMEIEEVLLSNHPPSSIGVQFVLENTTDDTFSVFPDQGVLVTSTGEQVEFVEDSCSDPIGGEIFGEVSKKGVIFWNLERTNIEELNWVKVIFNAYKEEEHKKIVMKLELNE